MIGILKAGWNAVECFINYWAWSIRPREINDSIRSELLKQIAEDLPFYARLKDSVHTFS
jgi:hypothetical protein